MNIVLAATSQGLLLCAQPPDAARPHDADGQSSSQEQATHHGRGRVSTATACAVVDPRAGPPRGEPRPAAETGGCHAAADNVAHVAGPAPRRRCCRNGPRGGEQGLPIGAGRGRQRLDGRRVSGQLNFCDGP